MDIRSSRWARGDGRGRRELVLDAIAMRRSDVGHRFEEGARCPAGNSR
jgi:hypothetical protein